MENPKARRRHASEGEEVSASTSPEVSPAVVNKLRECFTEILNKAQELGFELATLECSQSNSCLLVKKSRELIVTLKKLFELRKELGPT